MNKVLKVVLIVLAVLVVAGGAVFAGVWWGSSRLAAQPVLGYTGMGWMMQRGSDPEVPGFGPGMMQRSFDRDVPGFGPGMMRRSFGRGLAADLTPVTEDEATQAAQKFIDDLGLADLKIGRVLIYGNGAYVAVIEESTGTGAFELVVDPASKTAHAAGGADMMWNLKYGGVVTSAMGRRLISAAQATPAANAPELTLTAEDAVKAAQAYLDAAKVGGTAAAEPIKFYGFYAVPYSIDGTISGILNVNGYNGQVLGPMHAGMFSGWSR